MNTERFHNIEDIIGYTFHDLELLVTALTHKSYANERKINKVESYERSEFLGDAILEFVVSEYLYKNYPDYPEGKLTKLRASLVCEFTLSQISKELKFGHYVLLSKGEDLTGGRNRNSIMCDLFEAVLGAIYYLLIHPHVLSALDWLSRNLAFSFFIGFFYGVFLIDIVYSFNLIVKIRKLAAEYEIVVKIDELKQHLLEEAELRKEKSHFFLAMKNARPLREVFEDSLEKYSIKKILKEKKNGK